MLVCVCVYAYLWTGSSLVHVIACRLLNAQPSSGLMSTALWFSHYHKPIQDKAWRRFPKCWSKISLTKGYLVYFVNSLNKLLHKQSIFWWFETPWCSYDVNVMLDHGDVIKWEHFPRYWTFVRGIHHSPVNSTHKGQWRAALMFSLIYALNKRLSKQSRGWWFETPSRSLWRYCNDFVLSPGVGGVALHQPDSGPVVLGPQPEHARAHHRGSLDAAQGGPLPRPALRTAA